MLKKIIFDDENNRTDANLPVVYAIKIISINLNIGKKGKRFDSLNGYVTEQESAVRICRLNTVVLQVTGVDQHFCFDIDNLFIFYCAR